MARSSLASRQPEPIHGLAVASLPHLMVSVHAVSHPLFRGRRSGAPSDLGQHHARVAIARCGEGSDLGQRGAQMVHVPLLDGGPVGLGWSSLHGVDGSGRLAVTAHAVLTLVGGVRR